MKVLQLVLLLLAVFLGTSCASFLNRKTQTLYLTTQEPTILSTPKDTVSVYGTQHQLKAKRSKDYLVFTLETKLGKKQSFSLAPYNSFAYIFGYFAANYGMIMQYLFDRKSEKRYGYPTTIAVDMQQNPPQLYPYNAFEKTDYVLKFTPLKLISFHHASVEMALEKPTGHDLSTQLMISWLLPNTLFSELSTPKPNFKGFRMALEERLYLKKKTPYGAYFALEWDWINQRFWEEGVFYGVPPETNSNAAKERFLMPYQVHAQAITTSFKWGYQFDKNNYLIDLYLGIGKRFWINQHNYGNRNAQLINNSQRIDRYHELRTRLGKHPIIAIPFNVRIGKRF